MVGKPFDLFTFAPGDEEMLRPFMDRGPFPWWTYPAVRFSFFRPLSSALAVFDYAVFGRRFAWWHAHSILWYALTVFAAGLVFRRALPGPAAAVAVFLFAIDEVHWMPAAWLANRNALVAAAPALLGLHAHLRWRQDGWKPGLPLSLLGYGAGLLGGETALGAAAYALAYEACAGRGAVRERIRAIAPTALLGAAYLLFYRFSGYGAFGSGTYFDPLADPMRYASHAPARIAAMLGGQLLSAPVDGWVLFTGLRPALVLAGVAATAIVVYALGRIWRDLGYGQRRAVRWMIVGAVLSLLPAAATFPSTRLLLFPSVGGAAVVAVVLRNGWTARGARPGVAVRGIGVVLAAVHVALPVVAWPAILLVVGAFAAHVEDKMLGAEVPDAGLSERHVFMLVAPDPVTAFYLPAVRALNGHPVPAGWSVLSLAPHDHRVRRLDERTIEVEVIGGSMMETELEVLMRGPEHALRAGDVVRLAEYTVTVEEVTGAGPSRIRVEFAPPRRVEDPRYLFLVWRDGLVRPVNPPGIGERIEIPRSLGVFEMR